jgi:hypothetical protein
LTATGDEHGGRDVTLWSAYLLGAVASDEMQCLHASCRGYPKARAKSGIAKGYPSRPWSQAREAATSSMRSIASSSESPSKVSGPNSAPMMGIGSTPAIST